MVLIRQALTQAFDAGKLAAAWIALHPPGGGGPSAGTGIAAVFAGRARDALTRALEPVLRRLWTEAWVLGQKSAQALTAGLEDVDWGSWMPGDAEAAAEIAGPGLRQLLDDAQITIRSIVDSRLEDLSAVLEDALSSNEVQRPFDEPQPPVLSVQDLASRLEGVLDNPRNAEMVAWTEICRAQTAAAEHVYAENGVTEVDLSTSHDDRVCPICAAVADENPHPLGSVVLPLHPRERCALLPVVGSRAA